MTTYSHLIFDLDGTLINSKTGLYNSLSYMLSEMQLDPKGAACIDRMIGPPIQDGLKQVLGFNDRQVESGVRLFREYYSQKGLYEGELYPGVAELLEALQAQGKKLFIATSKKDCFVETVLREFELDRYLTDFQGAGDGALHTKAELITRLMDRNQLTASKQIVMIGDTRYDITGGKANEISTIGVGYGFGNSAEIRSLQPDYYVEDVDELTELLAG
ncbi:HAD hydrolase-like protein [Gaoshiqia sp. Z1-71]|uniref:HAD hydrolase-like protein n=1 Tax=Gaoshiqia hydrogeniformans TaxID=3290090 RepID=UPI003BF7E703